MRIQKIFLCVLLAVALAQEHSVASSLGESGVIIFDEKDAIKVPQANLIERDSNRIYPFPSLGVFSENQTISGEILGSSKLAGSELIISVASFNITRFLRTPNKGNGSLIKLNASGEAQFSLPGLHSGVYSMYLTDAKNSTIVSASAFLVSKGEIEVEAPTELKAGEPMKITVNAPGSKENKTFGAIMISREDYDSGRFNISTNGTRRGLFTTIALGNKSQQIEGLPGFAPLQLLSILTVLPEDSTVAMQESKESRVDLYLITDQQWQKGSYLLICTVYSQQKGLVGLKQEAIEVT